MVANRIRLASKSRRSGTPANSAVRDGYPPDNAARGCPMSLGRKMLLILMVTVCAAGCDQAAKSIAKSVLPKASTVSYLGDVVRFQLVHNSGAFMSLGASLPEAWRKGLFLVGVGALLLGLLLYAVLSRRIETPGLAIALAMIAGGGLGNILDRIAYDGGVIDFIDIGFGPLRTGVFNVADVVITVGMLLVFAMGWRRRRKAR